MRPETLRQYHRACNKRMKEEGGKARCCDCVPHEGCEFKICSECQFEKGKHSFECSLYKDNPFPPRKGGGKRSYPTEPKKEENIEYCEKCEKNMFISKGFKICFDCWYKIPLSFPTRTKEETVEEHHEKGHQFDKDIENCKIEPFKPAKWKEKLEDILLDVCSAENCKESKDHKILKSIVKERLQNLIHSLLISERKKLVEEIDQTIDSINMDGRLLIRQEAREVLLSLIKGNNE